MAGGGTALADGFGMMKPLRTSLGILVSVSALAGCNGKVVLTPEPSAETKEHSARLTRAESCADLEARLKQNALAAMNAQLDAMGQWRAGGTEEFDMASGATQTGTGSQNESSGSGGSSMGGATPESPEHSETNTQVAGVDEADIVKTDGNFLYLIHGQTLTILKAHPAEALALSATVAIEGTPTEMFLADDQVVVYSSVDGAPIFKAAGIPAPAPNDGGYGYGYGSPEPGGYPGYPGGGGSGYPWLTKVTVLKVDGAAASTEKELYFEGGYTSSRRVGPNVRTVLSGGEHAPALQYWVDGNGGETDAEWEAMVGKLRQKNAATIAATKLDDYLPRRFVKTGSSVATIPASCANYYVPGEGTTPYGMTQIQSIDLSALGNPPTDTTIVGAADTVYSSANAMYLAVRSYNNLGWGAVSAGEASVGSGSVGSGGGSSVGGAQPPPAPPSGGAMGAAGSSLPVSQSSTYLHKFDLTRDPAAPSYTAFGTVEGQVKNQFSLDERNGVLRIATTDTLVSPNVWETSNSVFALSQAGEDLVTTGEVRGLAKGETIYSVRFVGTRGYVVTFRQVDPLFVVDLENPAAPKVVAELKIPGFSEYMHPIDNGDRLLTIGRDGTEGGQVEGLALQVFDVRDAANPKLEHKYVFKGTDGYSEAQNNHKAFTYYKGMLAFPFVGYDNYNGTMHTSLELFRVSSEDGIEKLGSIDHSGFFDQNSYGGYCGGYYGNGVRRGLFIDDALYSISYGGVIVNDLSNLSEPVASLALPQPENDYYCGAY
jgi:uncharacterized secreted protein with C-terminal beta-propeller domain